MRTLKESIEYLNSINNIKIAKYDDCINHSYENVKWYEKMLEEVLKLECNRVVDVGSNLNQYGFLFANNDIEYIGIDNVTKKMGLNPIETDKIKFIDANYLDIREHFKGDVIISCLCIGYLIPVIEVKCKTLIINASELLGTPCAKVFKGNIAEEYKKEIKESERRIEIEGTERIKRRIEKYTR